MQLVWSPARALWCTTYSVAPNHCDQPIPVKGVEAHSILAKVEHLPRVPEESWGRVCAPCASEVFEPHQPHLYCRDQCWNLDRCRVSQATCGWVGGYSLWFVRCAWVQCVGYAV